MIKILCAPERYGKSRWIIPGKVSQFLNSKLQDILAIIFNNHTHTN